jgi:Zn-finger nucleic acid-binding protein/ribosomal protein L40E
MRLIVACHGCQRQFDAAGREIGSRFRCHCGEAVTISQPIGHGAAVVRCSSCGAPREEGASACRFCHSDFTLHERDLHTICPNCLARVSDKARFCHHCGMAITPELMADGESELSCPACSGADRPLVSRRLGELSLTVLECQHCAGLWVGRDAFQNLSQKVRRQAFIQSGGQTIPPPVKIPEPANWAYRRCIVCQQFMHRRNFAGGSGIIVDICSSHGIWFDDNELRGIVSWIRRGGQERVSFPNSDGPAASDLQSRGGRTGGDDGLFVGKLLTLHSGRALFSVIWELSRAIFRSLP